MEGAIFGCVGRGEDSRLAMEELDQPSEHDSIVGLQAELAAQRVRLDAQQKLLDELIGEREASEQEDRPTSTTIDVAISDNGLWGAAVFIGAPDVGALTSLILALLVVLEIYIEYQFCYSIYTYLVKDLLEEPSPATYRHWRETVAHSRGFMDANMTSLVERICALDDSVSVGGSQFEMLQIIDDYLEGSGGLMICCLSLLLWVLTVAKDLRANLTLRDAVAADAGATLPHLTRVRRRAFDVLCAIRAAFSVALLFIGSMWLGRTQEIENLVLNAAALGFVLELSDLLLAVMPRAFVHRVAEQPPLKLALGDCPFDTAVTAAGVVVVLLVAMGACAIPLTRDFRAVREAMCGGNRNFVAGANAEVGLQYAMETQPFDAGALKSHSFLQRAIQELIHYDFDGASPAQTAYVSASSDFDRLLTQSAADLFGSMECADQFVPDPPTFDIAANYPFIASTFAEVAGLDVARCANLTAAMCRAPGATVVRAMCPITCGCADARSGLVYAASSDFGCPAACVSVADAQSQALACEDMNATAPLAGWTAYFDQLIALDEYWHISEAMPEALYIAARDGGCKNLTALQLVGSDFCADNPNPSDYPYTSLASFCPVTCGCATITNGTAANPSVRCPSSCAA